MEPLERLRPHRTEARHGDDDRQEALVGLPAIALRGEEAIRFLKALERPCDRTANGPNNSVAVPGLKSRLLKLPVGAGCAARG